MDTLCLRDPHYYCELNHSDLLFMKFKGGCESNAVHYKTAPTLFSYSCIHFDQPSAHVYQMQSAPHRATYTRSSSQSIAMAHAQITIYFNGAQTADRMELAAAERLTGFARAGRHHCGNQTQRATGNGRAAARRPAGRAAGEQQTAGGGMRSALLQVCVCVCVAVLRANQTSTCLIKWNSPSVRIACRLCGQSFGLLGPCKLICDQCKKPMCSKCAIEVRPTKVMPK